MLSSLNSSSHCFFSLLSDEVAVAQLVDRALPTPRDPRSESRHQHNFIYQLYNRKDENKEKEKRRGMANLLKKTPTNDLLVLNKCEDPDA